MSQIVGDILCAVAVEQVQAQFARGVEHIAAGAVVNAVGSGGATRLFLEKDTEVFGHVCGLLGVAIKPEEVRVKGGHVLRQQGLRIALGVNRDEYHLNPDKVGVVGGSAGGHLSALVGMAGGKQAFPKIGGHDDVSDRVTCVCNIYGPANFATVMQQAEDDANIRNVFPFNMPGDPYSGLIGVSLNSDRDKTNAVSPVHYASRDNPPMLILHGTHDALVPYAQSVELAKVLKAQGVEVWLQTLPGSGHGGAAFGKPGITKLMQDFFDHHLQGADVKIALVPESDVAMPPPADAKK